MSKTATALLCLLAIACGDDDSTPTDAGLRDAGQDSMFLSSDAGPDMDAGRDAEVEDASTVGDAGDDAEVADAGGAMDAGADASVPDAGRDAGGACHGYDFGLPAATIEVIAAVPALSGGEIPLGVYDVRSVGTTGSITGTFRGTWAFEDMNQVQTLAQLIISDAVPVPTPRSERFETMGNRLLRAQNCDGDATFDNAYGVREEDGFTILEVSEGPLLFTFVRR